MNQTPAPAVRPIPSPMQALRTLLRADFLVQWRNRRALFTNILMPIIFLISWKSLIPKIGAAAVLAICIAIGLPATGLMGYPLSVARDREKGVFQKLRSAPVSTWIIMVSRIIVQLSVIVFMTIITGIFAYFADKITIPWPSIPLLIIASLAGGMAFLAIGQTVVALVKSSEAVNAVVRLIYFPLAILGALGEIGIFGTTVANIVEWSPFGTTKTLLVAAMQPSTIINPHLGLVFLATLGYGIIFAVIGIRQFQWSVN